ncbi:hypothetical protein Bca101_059466 [Brassica carinata]
MPNLKTGRFDSDRAHPRAGMLDQIVPPPRAESTRPEAGRLGLDRAHPRAGRYVRILPALGRAGRLGPDHARPKGQVWSDRPDLRAGRFGPDRARPATRRFGWLDLACPRAERLGPVRARPRAGRFGRALPALGRGREDGLVGFILSQRQGGGFAARVVPSCQIVVTDGQSLDDEKL